MLEQVSVIIPAYRSGRLIQSAIESVLTQNYPYIQLIICDDGTEGFEAKAVEEAIKEKFPHYHGVVVHQDNNIGTVKNLNCGLSYVTGKWILLLSADDILCQNDVISRLVEQSSVSKASWIVPRTIMVDQSMNNVVGISPIKQVCNVLKNNDMETLYKMLCAQCCLPSSGGFYQKNVLETVQGFDERFRLVEDWPLFLKLVRCGITPLLSDKNVVKHRGGGVSAGTAKKNIAYQRDLIQIMTQEIIPNLYMLSARDRKKVEQIIKDKQAIFDFRFSKRSTGEKLKWVTGNMGTLVRRGMHFL